MKTYHIACYASVAAALLLSACGGGGDATPEPGLDLLLTEQGPLCLRARSDAQAGAAFNNAAERLRAAGANAVCGGLTGLTATQCTADFLLYSKGLPNPC